MVNVIVALQLLVVGGLFNNYTAVGVVTWVWRETINASPAAFAVRPRFRAHVGGLRKNDGVRICVQREKKRREVSVAQGEKSNGICPLCVLTR